MTRNQITSIRYLDSVGIVRFEGRWIWPVDIRADAALADRFMASR